MRRITLAIVSTLAALVLLFSYRTSLGDPGPGATASTAAAEARVLSSGAPASTTSTTASTGGGGGDDPDQITAPEIPSVTNAAPTTGTTAPATGAQTVQGAEEMTRYGPVQVVVTISGGSITDVQAVQYPDRERRDQEINDAAIPEL